MNIPDWYVKDDWYAKHRFDRLLKEAQNERVARRLIRRISQLNKKK